MYTQGNKYQKSKSSKEIHCKAEKHNILAVSGKLYHKEQQRDSPEIGPLATNEHCLVTPEQSNEKQCKLYIDHRKNYNKILSFKTMFCTLQMIHK